MSFRARLLLSKTSISICTLILFLAAFGQTVNAEQNHIIAIIQSRDIAPYQMASDSFVDSLQKKGVAVSVQKYILKSDDNKDINQIKEMATSQKIELFYTIGTPATKIVRENIKNIPSVFSMVADPQGNNYSPPGVSIDISCEIKLREIQRIFPESKRIGVIYTEKSIPLYEELLEAANLLDYQLVTEKISTKKEFPSALKRLSSKIDFFFMIPDTEIYFSQSIQHLLSEGVKESFAVIGLSSSYTKAGALISFDCNYDNQGKQASDIAFEMISQKNTGSSEFKHPGKINFSLNMTVAKRLNINIPSSIKTEASEIF